jgi:hypothetical protein
MKKDKLFRLLKARLGALAKKGAESIYTQEQLESFFELSLVNICSALQITIDLSDEEANRIFGPLLIAFAAYSALSSQALKAESREISGMLWEQAKYEHDQWVGLLRGAREFLQGGECDCDECTGRNSDDEDVSKVN